MTVPELRLLHHETGGVAPRLCLRSDRRVDTGRWWRRSPLWLCVMEDELLLFAVARRRYVERIPLDACPESYYAAATGELVLEPGESLHFNRIALPPRDAVRILEILSPVTSHMRKNHE